MGSAPRDAGSAPRDPGSAPRDPGSELADERDRRRKLLDMILAEPPAAADAIAGIAKAAGWALPRRIAVIALGDCPPGDAAAVPALPPGTLIDWGRREPCVLVPDPDGAGRLSRIEQAMLGWEAAMGPVVPLARANMSLRWARAALGLAARGVIGGHGRLVRCDEHLSTLLIFSDEELAGALRAAQLAPLERLRPAQQDRLAETLLAWLQHGCNANEVAVRVHVHPQTVRYRSARWMTCSVTSSATPTAGSSWRSPSGLGRCSRTPSRRADRRQRRPAPPSRCLRQRSHPSCRRRGPLNPLLEPPMLIVRRL